MLLVEVSTLLVSFGLVFSTAVVPSQRSSVSHSVPRTVAELLRPRVRKWPCARPKRRRWRTAAPWIGLGGPAAALHTPEPGPVSVRSVRPSLLRWDTLNAPCEKTPLWVPLPAFL